MPSILIVDNRQCARELISEELIDEGYRVESVGDTKSAKVHLRLAGPDLVLLDPCLNGDDGWDALHHIKRQHPHLPVLIVTACHSLLDDPRLSQADGHVVKSTAFRELKQKIADALRPKQESQGRIEVKRCFPKAV